MDSVQSSEVFDECVNSQEKLPLDGVKRKRGYSQTLCNKDQTPPPKKLTPSDVLETEDSAAGQQLKNVNVKTGRCQGANAKHFSLEHFCDEVLYEIIKFLDTWTLLNLMNVSERFHKIVLDKRFWEEINSSQQHLPLRILANVLERTHEKTNSIKLMGPSSQSQLIEGEIQHFNKTLWTSLTTRCTNLAAMELFDVTLDFNELTFQDFPASLKRLVINNCNVQSPKFTGIKTILLNLEELAIEKNAWFDPYFIMAIAELPSLKYLSLKGCSQMKELIAHGSIAARYGFKQLEILDLSETPLNNSDLQKFNTIGALKELYLQCPEVVIKAQAASSSCNNMSTTSSQANQWENDARQPSASWCNISDMGVCCFGRTRVPVLHGVIWIGIDDRPMENRFERFSVRGYKHVTDISLEHLVQCSPHLVFLDVSGTSVTKKGVRRFRELKPECQVVAGHLRYPYRSFAFHTNINPLLLSALKSIRW